MRTPILVPLMALSLASYACKAQPEAPDPKTAQATKAPVEETASAASSQPATGAGLSAADRDARTADGTVLRGSALSAAATLSVADVFAKAETLDKKSVKVEGTVNSVCSSSGCWFVIEDGDKSIRITSKGYKFFVPSDVKGHKAVIEGDLAIKVLSQDEAQHFEDDKAAAGETAKKVDGPQKELSIAAVGLEMNKPNDG